MSNPNIILTVNAIAAIEAVSYVLLTGFYAVYLSDDSYNKIVT